MRSITLALMLGLMASGAFAQDWGRMATISSTMGVSDSRLCVGEASRGDIGCPSYAPSLTTAGDVSITGNISANKFIGDGSGLTNISSAQGDRITSGTLAAIANQATQYISLTTSAVDWGYLSAGLSYLPFLHAASVSSTNVSVTVAHHNGSAVTNIAGFGGNYIVSGTTSVSTTSAGTIGFGTDNTLRMLVDNSGNVGVGTASPNAKLDVAGAVLASGPSGAVSANGTYLDISGGYSRLIATGANTSTAGKLQLITASSNASIYNTGLTMDASGNVGIGTTNPSTTLYVSGIIATDGVTMFDDVNPGNGVASQIGLLNWDGGLAVAKFSSNIWQTTLFTVNSNGSGWLAGALTQNSDKRLKTNIHPISSALDRLSHINGVTFYWKDEASDPAEQMGVIAQDVMAQFPQLVHADATGTLGVNYSGLVAPLIEAVKQLKADNDNLRSRLEMLERKAAAK